MTSEKTHKLTPNPQIEKLRTALHTAAVKYGDLLHPEVIRASQELDGPLVQYFRNQLQLRSGTSKG